MMMIPQELLDEAYPIIEKLAKSRSLGSAFAYYTSDDVGQEIWCMCLDALDRYNPEIGPIENYLARHVSNRLRNLKRDKYFRPGSDVASSGLARTRMNLVNALPFGCGDIAEQGIVLGPTCSSTEPVDYILCTETMNYILDNLPEHLVEPFENMLGNNKVRSPLAMEVRQAVAEILVERERDD